MCLLLTPSVFEHLILEPEHYNRSSSGPPGSGGRLCPVVTSESDMGSMWREGAQERACEPQKLWATPDAASVTLLLEILGRQLSMATAVTNQGGRT